MGEYQKLLTNEGQFTIYVDRPSPDPAPVVVVLQEIFGINNDLRASCHELAARGFIAISPDLFWRKESDLDLNEWSESDWKKGLTLYASYDFDAGARDIAAVVQMARGMAGANGRVGVMGYCLGGLMTYLTAARTDVDAAVEYYGGGTEKYLGEAPNINAPMVIHLAEEDEFISKEAQADIKRAFSAQANVSVFSYPGCNHAFARHTGTHYDAAATTQANERTYAFLDQHLT
jgi:carboxymethylenebutenolidase